jgi:transcriptional regulator GlxA family with amidase domain
MAAPKVRGNTGRGPSRFGNESDEQAMTPSPPPARVAILAFPDASASVVYGMYDMFMSAGRDWGVVIDGRAGPPLFQPLVVGPERGSIAAMNDVRIEAHATHAECAAPRIVCIPDINVPPGEPLDGRFDVEVASLRRWYANGATLASACSGAMLLAQAGLLDGHEATTHWAYCDVLRRRHPAVKVRPQRALVVSGEGGRLVMAGAGTSWLDVALYLIARTAGVEAAMQVARINLIDWHEIGQQPFARLARSRQVDDALIARCQTWAAEHYHEASPVAAMARLSGLAERSFKRRFSQATGMSPLEYVHTLRIEEAKQMLESGTLPIEAIANEVGYEDAGFFARLFRRNVNLTPAQYRKRFGALRRRLVNGAPEAARPC